MKITDYPSIQELKENNIFLVDGPGGTKQLTAKDLATALTKLISMDRETYLDILDEFASVEDRKTTFGGRNLGNALTKEQAQNIVNGTFKGFFVGDYWEKDDRTWRIVDIDYWLGTGPAATLCKQHHLVIMPDATLADAQMRTTKTTEGGFQGASTVQEALTNTAGPIIQNAFISEDRLQHPEYLINATTSGYPSGGAWYNVYTVLPSEFMMFGACVYTPGTTGSTSPNRISNDRDQLALMKIDPHWVNPSRETFWLRNISGPQTFCSVLGESGWASQNYADDFHGLRPAIAVSGAETAAS